MCPTCMGGTRAWELLQAMRQAGLHPGVNTYTSLIDACGKGKRLHPNPNLNPSPNPSPNPNQNQNQNQTQP